MRVICILDFIEEEKYYELLYYNKNYKKIKENSIVFENIYRDGNCFSGYYFFFTGSEEYHILFRKLHLEEILIEFSICLF